MDFGALARALTPAANGYFAGQRAREQDDFQRRLALMREQRAQEEAQRQSQYYALLGDKLKMEMDPEHVQADLLLTRARALSALPELKAPEQLPGGTEVPGFKPWYLKAGYQSPDEFYTDLRHRQAITDNPRVPKEPNYRQMLDNVATASGGNLGRAYERLNQDPTLFEALGAGKITNNDVEAAATRAQQRAANQNILGMLLMGQNGNSIGAAGALPPQARKFPSESPESWVDRMKRQGMDQQQIMNYAKQQGITVDSTAFEARPGFWSRLFGGGD